MSEVATLLLAEAQAFAVRVALSGIAGKVQQLSEKEVQSFLEKARSQSASPSKKEIKSTSTAAPASTGADLEALRRQLDRINAELHDLRKRLDAPPPKK